MECRGLLPTTQFAYRKGLGPCDALLCVAGIIILKTIIIMIIIIRIIIIEDGRIICI